MADPEKVPPQLGPAPANIPAKKTDGGALVTETTVSSSTSDAEDIIAVRQRILEERALEKSEPPVLPITTLFRRKGPRPDLDAIATQPSVYDDAEVAKYFQPMPQYENLHRFDPSARWTWGEELPLINKLDWKVTLWAFIAFFALDLDRGNISQANTDNFLEDLGLTTNDFNLGNTVFRLSFLCAELPSQLISKKLGPDRWIPTIMVLWSIVALSQFWLTGRATFLACRALLGMLQGGFIPDVILYLSYFFKGTELPFRLALFWCSLRLTDILAPIFAFGLLRLRGVLGYEGWRWLFLIEGIFTLLVGVWSWFTMVASPTQTKSWWNKQGWFTEREEVIMVNRILRDDPSKGDMHNRQAVDFKLLWASLKDYDLWPLYIIGMCFLIPAGPPDAYLTLTLRNLGFGTFDSNLLSIPTQVIGAITMLTLTYYSEIWNTRTYLAIFGQLWLLPNVIALLSLPDNVAAWAKFAVLTVLLSYPSAHAMHVGWCSRNSNTVRTRTVSAALYNMFVQVGGIIHANIYRADDRPHYRRGNRVLVGINVANIFIYISTKLYYIWRNKQKEKQWSALSKDEQLNYLETTKDSGSKRLDFRFAH
ncbi:major facilitator superfamily domain-containing protein [Podospora aff. communis PSN243]|uniref:Major facilitator superfamily domain-containing protein n=1 Tax=Podospora aff. communis PSN243 TaxID=3040156 RepID=A0AAV9GME3_9PEZI|nr:major facilitator superfamily domain-containing protein [Podospora aff. communis PSN243]